jgi:hypothetical protein
MIEKLDETMTEAGFFDFEFCFADSKQIERLVETVGFEVRPKLFKVINPDKLTAADKRFLEDNKADVLATLQNAVLRNQYGYFQRNEKTKKLMLECVKEFNTLAGTKIIYHELKGEFLESVKTDNPKIFTDAVKRLAFRRTMSKILSRIKQ